MTEIGVRTSRGHGVRAVRGAGRAATTTSTTASTAPDRSQNPGEYQQGKNRRPPAFARRETQNENASQRESTGRGPHAGSDPVRGAVWSRGGYGQRGRATTGHR